jgi:selenocysteine lyase/cysteine desulfurase
VLLCVLAETPGVTVYGIQDTRRLEERVPTCAFTLKGKSTRQVAEQLDEANIYVLDRAYYSLGVNEHLGLEKSRCIVRVGTVNFNTVEEIEMFEEVLSRIAYNEC